MKLSGKGRTPLQTLPSRALRENKERIVPIKAIMRDLLFYNDDHRLQITPRENQSEAWRTFRAVLLEAGTLIGRIRHSGPDLPVLVDVRNQARGSRRAGSRRHQAARGT